MVQLGICADVASCKVTADAATWGFLPVTDATFDPVRKVCAETQNAKCSKG
jgi:hypothetical protein